jgi:leucyl aminopeptidase
MKIRVDTVSLTSNKWGLAGGVYFADPALNAPLLARCPSPLVTRIDLARDLKDFSGKKDESLLLYGKPDVPSDRVFLVGAGAAADLTLERLRRAAASIVRKANICKATSAAFIVPSGTAILPDISPEDIAQAVTEAIILSLYSYDRYKTKDKKPTSLTHVTLLIGEKAKLANFRKGIASGTIIANAVSHVRDLANAPGAEIYPATLADDARKTARACGFSATIFDRKKIARLGMGGIINVGKGSQHDPRFIILEHKPRAAKRTIVLVGKGVTFDSGGISIKPSANMGEMRMDMHGAASVIGTIEAAARMHLPVRIIGLIPAVENMPSGTAVKPGDIIRQYNGMTTEVDNTDAEGRLVLADALSYAARYTPDVIIDLATLTGAVVVALGHHATGMMGTDAATMASLKIAGDKMHERVWELPLFEEYDKQIKSDVADVKNVGGRWAGAITGGAFLKNFVGTQNWVHLDIAGTSYLEDVYDYIPKGASGVGVRLLIEYMRSLK